MAMTLAEAEKLTSDAVLSGVFHTIVKESPVLGALPFADIVGNALLYNRENAAATVDFRSVGETWTESTATFTQKTAALKVLGGDADVDAFLAATRSSQTDLEAVTIELKAKALAHEWDDTFIYGDATANPKEFDGLHVTIAGVASTQQVHAGSGSTAGVLTLAKLDELIDAVKPGKPSMLMMSRRSRRGLSKYSRSLTSPVAYEPNEFGQRTMFYDGIPIGINDFQLDTETISGAAYTAATGGSSSSIFALRFGEDGLLGLKNGELPTIEEIGALETKDARRWRVKAYVGLALMSAISIARLDGISSGDVTA